MITDERLYQILLTKVDIKLIHSMIKFVYDQANEQLSQTEQEKYKIIEDALDDAVIQE